MSEIVLYFPDVIIGVRGDALLSCCRSARKQSSLTARIDVETLLLYSHATAGAFSQKLQMCLKV